MNMTKIRLRPFAPKGLLTKTQSKQLTAWYEGENRIVSQREIAEVIDITPKTLRKMFKDNPERPFDNFKLKTLNSFIELYNKDIQEFKELQKNEVKETRSSLKLAEKLIDKVEE